MPAPKFKPEINQGGETYHHAAAITHVVTTRYVTTHGRVISKAYGPYSESRARRWAANISEAFDHAEIHVLKLTVNPIAGDVTDR